MKHRADTPDYSMRPTPDPKRRADPPVLRYPWLLFGTCLLIWIGLADLGFTWVH